MGNSIGARRARVRGGRGPHGTVPAGKTPSGTAPWTHAAVARVRARRPGGRPAILAAALAATALLAAACGGGGGTATSAQLTNYQKALAFSQCMRAHGEPGFPDPQPDGSLLINGPKDHLNGALMNSASKACQHLMPKAPPLTASQQQKLTARTLRFVACMRAHGLPTFPDPQVNSSGIELQLPKGLQPNSPVFRAAQRACKKLMPGLP
jgi:hypothetical protein